MREYKHSNGGNVPKKDYKKPADSQSNVMVPPLSYETFDGIPEKPLPPKENSKLNVLLKYLPTKPVAFRIFCYGFCLLYGPVVRGLSDKFNDKVAGYKGDLESDPEGLERANKIAKGFEHIQTSLSLLKSDCEEKKYKVETKDLISTSFAMENVLSHLRTIKDEFASWDI